MQINAKNFGKNGENPDYKNEKRGKIYAFHLLAKRDYLSQELKNKLVQKSYDEKTAQNVVKELEEKGFLNDLRVAQNLIDFYKEKKGENWIRQKLMQKGLRNFDGLDFENYDFNHIIRNVIGRYKLVKKQDIDLKLRAKIYRFLISRGYKNTGKILEQIMENLA